MDLKVIDHSDLSPIEKARARALAKTYPHMWTGFDAKFVAAELELSVTLKGTDDGEHGDWVLSGTIDTLCKRKGEYVMIEHKTRTGDVTNLSDGYYRSLAHNTQITLYCILLQQNGYPVEQTIYDVIRKIGSTKRRIPAGTAKDPDDIKRGTCQEIEQYGTYHGLDCEGREMVRLANYNQLKAEKKHGGPFLESDHLYESRITVEVAEKADMFYHQLGQLHRSYEQMGEFVKTLKDVCRQIDAINSDDEACWSQNTSQCNSYGTACEYMDVCGGSDDLSSDNYQDRRGGSTSGDRTLSHSKMTCFLSCQRKYFYRYKKKREHARIKPPALKFGSVLHEFFAEFWQGR